jgi:hypothetical protein
MHMDTSDDNNQTDSRGAGSWYSFAAPTRAPVSCKKKFS